MAKRSGARGRRDAGDLLLQVIPGDDQLSFLFPRPARERQSRPLVDQRSGRRRKRDLHRDRSLAAVAGVESFETQGAVAVLIGQRVIGVKRFQE